MTKLMIKQELNIEEKKLVTLFYNNSKPVTINLIKENNLKLDFIENLMLLKTKDKNLILFNRLIKIYENTNLELACKYLNGFLEDHGVSSIKEYLKIDNN